MRPRRVLVTAAAVYWVIARLIPFGGAILYPLTLLVTWVHEMGHGLTAALVGGSFRELAIFSDASGLALTTAAHGGPQAAVSAGGLLAPPLLGAAILAFVHTPRRARLTLAVLAGVLIASAVIWVRSVTGLIVVPLLAALLGWVAWRGLASRPHWCVVLVQILGMVLAVDTLTRMVSYVFTEKVDIGEKQRLSDVAILAENAGGHYLLWGVLLTLVACGLLAVGLWRAWGASATLAGGTGRRSRQGLASR
jgi:hypothetical protein